jgi:putative FmdB family regulatory protein
MEESMPTYVYHCDGCGQQFEHFQSFKDAPLNTCVCGKQGSVRRVFQPVGIVFKGSGWYINDSRSKGSKDSSGDQADSSSKAETTSDTTAS